MATLQIRFVNGTGWDSKIIEWWSGCPWSHVELYFPEGHPLIVGYGARTFGAQLRGGVVWRTTDDPAYVKAKQYMIWEIPITDGQMELLRKLIADANGAKYDVAAIVSFVLGQHKIHLTGRWICSGYLAGVFDSLNLAEMVFDWEAYEPAHIWMLIPNVKGAKRVV